MTGLLTYEDVARILGCCERKVRDDYVKTGLLRTVPLGRLVRFTEADVQALVRHLRGEVLGVAS
jgi:excisionase family DNA binding protein